MYLYSITTLDMEKHGKARHITTKLLLLSFYQSLRYKHLVHIQVILLSTVLQIHADKSPEKQGALDAAKEIAPANISSMQSGREYQQ